ncbi:16S rRNA (guanine(527)-N(7))-methyltransferase RsmG [Sulfurovum sp. bin170]|uniref:16S rRNA (guanine(527)-N(7))-methyltransferase RsmG n=1 Tax=Sulfurovum sp. bin170 TaxID=2695268 RepID=UPI0013E05144|nr:16S rRNA (guanine(527)-N(7))-methyltransferase RsmG [Sulfurovum sp. bin170]NEW61008.1 16S rRNA (guanine(527)-N(7))-methyltransferase RsmG [Sulfurovum sp. bin170]
MNHKQLKEKILSSNISFDNRQIEQLEKFTSLLEEWNKIHNLTGAKTKDEIYKNILDSLYPYTFIKRPNSILDVGTGAGFPGLILAIAYPKCKTVLCEPRNKRASFLKFVAMELKLENVEVVKKRVEDYHFSEPFELITSRAVTNTKMLLSLTQHLQDDDTRFLFYKGEKVFSELELVDSPIYYDIIEKNQRNYLYIKG